MSNLFELPNSYVPIVVHANLLTLPAPPPGCRMGRLGKKLPFFPGFPPPPPPGGRLPGRKHRKFGRFWDFLNDEKAGSIRRRISKVKKLGKRKGMKGRRAAARAGRLARFARCLAKKAEKPKMKFSKTDIKSFAKVAPKLVPKTTTQNDAKKPAEKKFTWKEFITFLNKVKAEKDAKAAAAAKK